MSRNVCLCNRKLPIIVIEAAILIVADVARFLYVLIAGRHQNR